MPGYYLCRLGYDPFCSLPRASAPTSARPSVAATDPPFPSRTAQQSVPYSTTFFNKTISVVDAGIVVDAISFVTYSAILVGLVFAVLYVLKNNNKPGKKPTPQVAAEKVVKKAVKAEDWVDMSHLKVKKGKKSKRA